MGIYHLKLFVGFAVLGLALAQGDYCYTPYRRLGQCRPFQQCYSLLRLFERDESQNTVNFLVQSQKSCGNRNYNGDPVLCCSDKIARKPPQVEFEVIELTEGPPAPAPTTPAPTFAPAPVLPPAPTTQAPDRDSRFSFPESAEGRESVDGACYGPDQVPGFCISLRNCPTLLNRYASQRGDRRLIQFIQESNKICNFAETAVCCPSSPATQAPPPEDNTRGGPIEAVPTSAPPSLGARLLTPNEGCGFSNASHNRVVGGVPAKLGAWPWMALLGYEDALGDTAFKCGGSLITSKHILTAAHCIRSDLKSVRLGEHDLSTPSETPHEDVRVARVITHPAYDKRDGHSDLAILVLERPVAFSRQISPICIATEEPLLSKDYVDYSPFVAGWGRTAEGGKSATVLQELQLPVLANQECKTRYTALRRNLSEKQFDNKVICVGYREGGRDSCQGDSGGPLMIPNRIDDQIIFFQIGIVSYGIGCARSDTPGVYTSVQRFTDWIQNVVNQNQ